MAKKSGGGGVAGAILLAIIAAVAALPKEVWMGAGVLAGLGFVAYLFFKGKKSAPPTVAMTQFTQRSPAVPTKSRPGSNTFAAYRDASAPAPRAGEMETAAQCWVPPGSTVEVKGHGQLGGMLYFGKGLHSVRGYQFEPALIHPGFNVDWTRRGDRMPYWPSYATISPSSRGEYLEWLIGGCKDPDVQMGCVFLYFYGLERRILHDFNEYPEAVEAESSHIEKEVQRLLFIYGTNNSFRSYASAFLDLLRGGAKEDDRLYERSAPEPTGLRQLLFAHRLALGQAARDGVPLPAGWAYSWLMHDPVTGLRKVAERCPEEFKKVFTTLYNQRFGAGLKLPVNKTRLKLAYRPASPSFERQIEFETGNVPDVTVLEGPISQLRSLADQAADALDSYSRFIGRNPDKQGTMDAIVLLPPVLWPRDSLVSFGVWLKRLGVEREMQACSLNEMMRHFPSWGTMNKERAAAFAYALEQFGVGLEPDARWGGPLPSEDAPVVLFAIPHEERGKKPSHVYSAAALTLHLSAAVASADGVSVAEEEHLEENVERMLHLQLHERLRLRAHLKWLLLSKPTLTSMKKRVAGLDASQRAAIGAFVVTMGHLEGGLSQAEMKALAKVYRILELPEDLLYREAHAAATEPVTVKASQQAEKRYAIPAKPVAPAKSTEPAKQAELDAERIAKLKEESARVSALLGAIFSGDDEAPEPTEAEEQAPQERTIAGLDAEHSSFAKLLMARNKWWRAELEDLAADRDLMLDGALERVNEAFMDVCGELLLDGNDPVEINENAIHMVEHA